MPSRQSWSKAKPSLPCLICCSFTMSSISRKDMSSSMPLILTVSNCPLDLASFWRQIFNVKFILLVAPGRKVNVFKCQGFLGKFGLLISALIFPGTHVTEVLVIALRFAFGSLAFLTEMTAAGFFAVERVRREELRKFEEVRDAAGSDEALVEGVFGAEHVRIFPEPCTEFRNELERLFEARLVAAHAHVLPHDVAEFAVDFRNGAVALEAQELVQMFHHLRFRILEGPIFRTHLLELGAREVTADGVRNDEVTVGEALHQRGCAEAVSAVVGEVRFAEDEAARDGAHQVVIDPEAAHGVMDSRVDAHRDLVRIFIRDLLVHLEEVAVLGAHAGDAEAPDGVSEVEVNGTAAMDAHSLVADHLGIAARDIARNEVAEGRIAFLEVVVAFRFRDLIRGTVVARLFRNPHTTVIAEGFGHQGQLGLMLARDRNAGRVNLRVAGVREESSLLVCLPGRAHVGTLGVGGEVEHVAVTAGGEADRVADVAFEFAGHHVAHHDSAGVTVDDDEILHVAAGEQFDGAARDLAHHGLISADEELLTRLTAGVERAGDLRAAEGAVVEKSAVVTSERDALRDALVDDEVGAFREAVHVRFTRTEVAALHGVVEQAVNGVAVVLVILGGVDTALGRDGVRAARSVLEAEHLDIVAELAEGSRGGSAREAGADDDDRELALVGRVHELEFEFVAGPLFSDRAAGNFRVENHRLAASVKGAYIGDLNVIHRSGHDERGLLLVLNGLLDFQGLLITEVTGMLDELLRFGLVRNSEAARRGDEEAAGDDDAVENTELFDDRGPLAVSDAERLERGSDRMEQVHSDDEHADDVERRPADLGEHHDRGEPHIAHDGAAGDIDILVIIVFTELEHVKMGDEESDDEETGPDHREGREGLLALARIHFVGFRAAGLAVLELESDREEHVGEEHHNQHRFDAVQEEVRLGEERGVGGVGRLRGCRMRVEQLQVANQVAQDEEREERARASHNLLPPDGGGQIFDDPLHIGFVSLCAIRR